MKTWNQRLAEVVAESGISKNSLAKELGVSAPTLQSWIGGSGAPIAANITAENLLRICDRFNVRPEWLIRGREPKTRGELTGIPGATLGGTYPGLGAPTDQVTIGNAADAEEMKRQIMQALAGEALSDELLVALAWMIRAGTQTHVQGDQHHERTVNIKHGRGAAQRKTG
ncbi:helix-turn-helix domain-containing protein [Paraburkholderia silvatlantica]|uniref:helix-turn-helix domain-containing protein n=1 Tax=Paraburkholderia silvatlantica TaxID=321895 RepID=UPI000DA214C1|nr:helix-turn-helix transcriptional regulator [Paraburkholderia silvatlantica]